MTEREQQVAALYRARPRSRFLRTSVWVFAALVALAWFGAAIPWPWGWVQDAFVSFAPSQSVSADTWDDLTSFFARIQPKPMRDGEGVGAGLAWTAEKIRDPGIEATANTLAIAIAAIVLAGLGGLVMSLPAARTLATPQPFLPASRAPSALARALWAGIWCAARAVLIFLRSVPEYIWGFLLLAMLGPSAWPAVLALALHNVGILGKLDAEVIEDTDPGVARTLRSLGSSRAQIVAVGLLPAALPRFLLYFFYRWETCVREAMVLGMLGFSTLGYWIFKEARPRMRYDEMVLLIILGAALVIAGDLLSALARWYIRKAK